MIRQRRYVTFSFILLLMWALTSSLTPSTAVPVVYAGSNTCADRLFISEYIEGSSNNKAIEIYNGTGNPITLTGNYSVQMFFNGSGTAGLTINLVGTVAAGNVFVLAHSSANATILGVANQTNGSGWYTGNDAITLRQGTTVIDSIGQVGFDPTTEWGTGLLSTADNTLQRKPYILAGETTTGDVYNPATSGEWNGFAVDTFTGLGSHTVACTHKTVGINGTFTEDEWGLGLGAINNVQFAATWDANSLYFAANDTTGTGFSDTDFLMVAIDTDASNENPATNTGGGFGAGNNGQFCGARFPNENKPDFIARVRQNPYFIDSWRWNGTTWVDAAWTEGGAGNFDMSGNANTYEMRINRAAEPIFGNMGNQIGVYMWLTNTSCEFFNAWPPENDNAYRAGSGAPGNGVFMYAATRFQTTDNGRFPPAYGRRVGWDTDATVGALGAHNFFGEDDQAANPWLRMTTLAEADNNCTVRAKIVTNNAFQFGTGNFIGVNRYIDFALTNCTALDVTVQMRYETAELNGSVEDVTLKFFRCPTPVGCSPVWTLVQPPGHVYSQDAANNNLSVTKASEADFSLWTIGNQGNTPTAVSLHSLSGKASSTGWLAGLTFGLTFGLGILAGIFSLWVVKRGRSR